MKLICKDCKVELGEVNKGRIKSSVMVVLCIACYDKLLPKRPQNPQSNPDILNNLFDILGVKR